MQLLSLSLTELINNSCKLVDLTELMNSLKLTPIFLFPERSKASKFLLFFNEKMIFWHPSTEIPVLAKFRYKRVFELINNSMFSQSPKTFLLKFSLEDKFTLIRCSVARFRNTSDEPKKFILLLLRFMSIIHWFLLIDSQICKQPLLPSWFFDKLSRAKQVLVSKICDKCFEDDKPRLMFSKLRLRF